MRHPQLARDDTRPDPVVGHFHDLVTDVVGQRPAVDENAAKLVDSALAQRSRHCREGRQERRGEERRGRWVDRERESQTPFCAHMRARSSTHTHRADTRVQQASMVSHFHCS